MLYTLNGSYPAPLPHRIVLSDGTKRTDSSSFTEEEIVDAGYVAVDPAPVAEYPSKVEWTGSEWAIREPSVSETHQKIMSIKDACVTALEDTDYKVIKSYELAVPLEQAYVTYREALRNLYNTVDASNAWSVQMPYIEEVTE